MKKVFAKIAKYRALLLLMCDIGCIILSYLFAYLVRFDFKIRTAIFDNSYFLTNLIKFLPIIILLNIIVLLLFKVNKTLWKYFSLDEVVRVVASVIVANFIWFVYVIIFLEGIFIRGVPPIATLFIIFTMLGVRISYRLWRRYVQNKNAKLKTLIVGAGDAGNALLKDIQFSNRYNNRVIGFIDDDKRKKGRIIAGTPILGGVEDIMSIHKDQTVDMVLIAIPSASKAELKRIIDLCQEANIRTKIMNYQENSLDERVSIRDVSIEDLLGRGEIHLASAEISAYLTNKTIMISGAGGSIGSELCRQIMKFKPKCMVMFDIYENNLYNLQQEIWIKKRNGEIDTEIEEVYLIGSVRDKKRIDYVLKTYKPNVVYHAAAHKHVPLMEDSPKEAIKNNVFGTYNTLSSCIENEIERFILISTDKAVNPTNVMGASKRMCELIIQSIDAKSTKVSAVRFGNVLGSNGSVIPVFKQQIESGGPITVTHKDIVRYFMTIPEAAQLVLQAGAYAQKGEIFVLDMGKPVKILTLAEELIKLSGLKPYDDIKIEFSGLRPGEKMFEELSLNNEEFTKTNNALIYLVKPMKLTSDELKEKLRSLELILNDEVANEVLRDNLFDIIR